MVTKSEARTLGEFSLFLMTPHQMLCFSGPGLEKHTAALESLAEKKLVVREKRRGAYSLTDAGYAAMQRGGRVN